MNVRRTSISTPHDFSTSSHKSQLGNIDLDDRSLCQHAQLRVQRVLRVLLDTDDRQLNRNAQLRVRNVCLLVTQTHGTNKALVLDRSTREPGPYKCGLGNHTFPALLRRLLSRLNDAEHLFLTDTLDFGQGHGEPCRFFVSLLLDGAREGFGVLLVAAVEQVLGQGFGGGLGGLGGLDVALFVCADRLLHLDLLLATLLGVKLCAQTAVVLRLLGAVVAFTRDALARALIVIEALAMPGEG
jgi:hypothetical protein